MLKVEWYLDVIDKEERNLKVYVSRKSTATGSSLISEMLRENFCQSVGNGSGGLAGKGVTFI